MTTWGDFPNVKTIPDDTDELMMRTPSGGPENKNARITTTNFLAKLNGSTVKFVYSLNDLPPLVLGFRKLEQDTVYVIAAQIFISDDILFPAGWNGTIYSTHVPTNALVYTGSNSFLNTLNIDGIILSIADSAVDPGVKSTVTISDPHGLSNGDFINITGTLVETVYSKPRLVISNVTASTFDVEIVFTATDTGLFDTGILALQLPRMAFFNDGFGTLFNISFTPDPVGLLAFNDIAVFNFEKLGTIRNAPNISARSGIFTFFVEGLILEDCDTVGLHHSNISCISPVASTAKCITLTGDKTRDVVITTTKLKVAVATQSPVRIDPSITSADEIVFQNSPDNDVATDYFDTSSGGLTQKDKQVTTVNNGKRKNSVEQSESMSVGIIQVPGITTDVAEPIQKAAPVSGDFELDSTVEGFTMDDATGIVTYDGRAPITVKIEYSLEAAQFISGNQTIDIDLRINASLQSKTIRSVITIGTDSFTPVSYLGGFFDIIPGDTFQLFKTNHTNDTDTEIQKLVLLIK